MGLYSLKDLNIKKGKFMVNKAKEKEIWKVYPKIPFIEASNLGRVRTKDRYVPNGVGKRLVKGHIMKQRVQNDGYLYVQFSVNGKVVGLRVSRVIAITFIPNLNNLPEVNHIDNNPTNNSVSNLEWCTHEYNMAYRGKYGKSAKEAAKALRKSVIVINPETSEVLYFESQHEAARQLDIHVESINRVVKGKQNIAGGYWITNADENTVDKVREKFGDEIARKVEELIRQNKN